MAFALSGLQRRVDAATQTNSRDKGKAMGVVIRLDERRDAKHARRKVSRGGAHVELFFDLGDPFSYLAAERADRAFGTMTWTPATGAGPHPHALLTDPAARQTVRRRAEERAAELRMPLVWPERFPNAVPLAMRAASLAAEQGRAAAFALAAGRLAYCGGFDLDEPEILAEAAAASGVGFDECLAAAGDPARDAAISDAGRRLQAAGADRLPALRVGRALFWGEERIPEAAAAARSLAG